MTEGDKRGRGAGRPERSPEHFRRMMQAEYPFVCHFGTIDNILIEGRMSRRGGEKKRDCDRYS